MDRDASSPADGPDARGQGALRLLRWFVLALAAACLLLIVALVKARFGGPSPERREAMRVMEQPAAPVRGRDGSDAFWLLDRDVPEAQRAAVAAATRGYLERKHSLDPAIRAKARGEVDPRTQFPEFPELGDEPLLCNLREPGCLARVRAQPDAVAALLSANAGQLRAAQDVLAFDGVRLGVTPSLSQELPSFGAGRRLAHLALVDRFVRGEHDAALAGTCDEIAAWRRLGADNDVLIGSMIGTAFVHDALVLLAGMLAELPADHALPAACVAALAPTRPAELDLCPAMRNEYALAATALDAGMASREPGDGEHLVRGAFDDTHFRGVLAPRYARFCSAALRDLAAADRAVAGSPPPAGCGPLEAVVHPLGCALASAAADGSYDRYLDRRTDQAAAIALMRTLAWLRAQPVDRAAWPALLRQRPESLGLRRTPSITPDGARLEIPRLDRSRGPTFALPLVPAPAPAAADAANR